MKTLHLILFLMLTLLTGCGAATLPKPNTAKTAGTEALVAYGLAAHVENQYLALPVCTKPLTAVPCKTKDIADRLKAADETAFNAAVAADKAVNDPAAQQNAADALKNFTDANAAAKAAANQTGGKQ